ncbi:polyprenyl diphosphate synthase [Streptomyces sp. NBC_01275]|uniref:polyprenyl diphosphate synthase n=1 Tax=Streptomyces sp. NBC_01275 TaxID=2903807 RepID=UPI0022556AA9|nr:polyprenyl diphosphate synthase [Streptomyces sp. NBC_01275]MCX4760056.1 polyprenyl diphosphate synthase [Streptomyces sp. NBC_01275]
MAALRHVAVIVDGNRRWARAHHTDPASAYRRGGDRVHELLTWCEAAGMSAVTLWPLSADNLRRDPGDVRALVQVITEVVGELVDAKRWHLNLFGNTAFLGKGVHRKVCHAARHTGVVSGMTVNIAVAYDGREDITSAVRSLLTEHAGRGTAVADIVDGLTSDQIAGHLSLTGQPPVDLIIRTSGEQRLSGFLPWQSAYSEFYFCDVNWPDFTRADFDAALLSYTRRSRRYGQ